MSVPLEDELESPTQIAAQENRVRNDFLFEWYQKFHADHYVLRSIYNFNKKDCVFNLRYLAMVMHLAVPEEFDPIIS